MEQHPNDREDKPDYETTYYRYSRDLAGNQVPVDIAKRNGRQVPYFSPNITDPPWLNPPSVPNLARYLRAVRKITRNLTRKERRTFLRIHQRGWSIDAVAKKDGVRRQAIYAQINAMVKKNFYCKISAEVGRFRKKINQHG
jgi:hypothetical protein